MRPKTAANPALSLTLALGAGLTLSLALPGPTPAHAAPIEDGFYEGRYFGGDVRRRDQEPIQIIVETVQVESSDDPEQTVPLTLALMLKKKSNEAGLFSVAELPDGTHRWRALTSRSVGQGEYAWEVPSILSEEGEFAGEIVSRGDRPELRLTPTQSGLSQGCAHQIRVRKAKREKLRFLTLPEEADLTVRDRAREKKASNSLTVSNRDQRASGVIEGARNAEAGKFTLVEVDEFGGKILYAFYPTQMSGEAASGKIPGHLLSAMAVFLERDRAVLEDTQELRLIQMTGAGCKRPMAKLKRRER